MIHVCKPVILMINTCPSIHYVFLKKVNDFQERQVCRSFLHQDLSLRRSGSVWGPPGSGNSWVSLLSLSFYYLYSLHSLLSLSLSLNQLILANSFQIFKRLLKQGKFLSFWTILPRKDLLHRWFKSWNVFSVWDYWCILEWRFFNVCVLETARKISPCIVFIDEIDSLASNRTHSLYTTEAANQTLNQLLTELDG